MLSSNLLNGALNVLNRQNNTYAYGMFVLSLICFIVGFLTIKLQGLSVYRIGFLFLGLFLVIQYFKSMGRMSHKMIKVLTWVTVVILFVIDIILLFSLLKRE